ncbi:MAG: hypothetical protein LUO89_00255 [Methanothrix sp.]|nr:hypothetical protein [Methanothrix sp.]
MTIEPIRLSGMQTQVRVGKEIKAGERAIWPVMRITTLNAGEDRILSIRIAPLAMLIIEPAGEYAVSFDGVPMKIEAIIELASPLRDVLEKAREGRRIKVD